ncbi:MAG: energy-coupling factor transporter transmembrane component T family protein [Bacillota bacterium]
MEICEKKIDPRSKLVIVLCISTAAVLMQNVYILSAVLLLTMAVSILFGSNPIKMIVKIKRLLWVIIAIAIVQSIFSPTGKDIISFRMIPILTTGGVVKGMEFVLRMMIVVISASIITTSSAREIIQGLVQWKIPYQIAFMAFIGIRFLPILTEEIKDTMTAIQLRGIQLDKIPFGKKLTIYSYVFTPVIAGTITKAKKLSTALETKAFGAYPYRTSYRTLEMTGLDYVMITTSLCVTAAAIILYICFF